MRGTRPRRRSSGPLIAVALLLAGPAGAASIVDPGFGPFSFTGGSWELSGLARVTGDQYYAVGDTGGLLVPLAIGVDPATGAVSGVTPGAPVVLAGGVDLEGIVWDPGTSTVLVSDEVGPAIRRHDPVSGALVGTVSIPPIFSSARPNRSLESLSRNAASGVLWTANEDALVPDGAATTFAAGGVVRLQRFGATDTAALASLTSGSYTPVYRQLAEHLVELVDAGRLLPGERLPASRELAAALAEKIREALSAS